MTPFSRTLGVFLGVLLVTRASFAAEELTICTGEALRGNVLYPIAEPFEKKTGIKIVYPMTAQEAGALISFQGLLAGKCEAAGSAGDFKNWMEIVAAGKVVVDGKDFTSRVIGRDLIKMVAHPGLKVPKLTLQQLADVFTGKAKNWKEVGGPDLPVKVFLAAKKPATSKNIQGLVMKNAAYSPDAIHVETWELAIPQILKTPGSIMFMSGTAPSPGLTVLETTEEVGRPLTLATKGKPSARLLKLYDFIRDEGPKYIKR